MTESEYDDFMKGQATQERILELAVENAVLRAQVSELSAMIDQLTDAIQKELCCDDEED